MSTPGARRDFVLTAFVEFSTLVAAFLTLRLAARALGTAGFGEYAVARRGIGVLAMPLLLGLGISLPRYVARVSADAASRRAYFLASLLMLVPVLGAGSALALAARGTLASWFYGDAALDHLVPGIVIAVIGFTVHTLVYAYLRGALNMPAANGLQFIGLAVVAPGALALCGGSPSRALTLTGAGWLAFGALASVWALAATRGPVDARHVKARMRELVRFGLPRVPGEFALVGLLAIPTFLVARSHGVEQAGFFSFGLSLLQAVASIFSTLGILLLPYVSRLAADARWDAIDRLVHRSLIGAVLTAVAVVLVLQVALRALIDGWMGPAFAQATGIAREMLLASIPYTVYLVLRNPLDAVSVWPHNSVNVSASMVIAVVLVWSGDRWVAPGHAMLLALSVLGALSLLSWRLHVRPMGVSGARHPASELPGPARP